MNPPILGHNGRKTRNTVSLMEFDLKSPGLTSQGGHGQPADAAYLSSTAVDAQRVLDERKRRSRRAVFVKWLRKLHGWIGLWGALLGLLFGTTGFFLNHRAEPMRISTGAPQVSQMLMPVPSEAAVSPHALSAYLQKELHLDGKPGRMRKEASRTVAWGDKTVVQPEHWTFNIGGPRNSTAVDYWVGSPNASIRQSQNTVLAALTNMHKGVGMSIGWVLLIDTLAGSLILLSLTGVLLWTELTRKKTIGAAIVAASIVAILFAAL